MRFFALCKSRRLCSHGAAGWSVLPVAANIAATIGGYTYSAKTIRMVGLRVNSPLWVIYDVAVGSWAGILDEAASSVSVLVSIARYGWKNLDTPEVENGMIEEG